MATLTRLLPINIVASNLSELPKSESNLASALCFCSLILLKSEGLNEKYATSQDDMKPEQKRSTKSTNKAIKIGSSMGLALIPPKKLLTASMMLLTIGISKA